MVSRNPLQDHHGESHSYYAAMALVVDFINSQVSASRFIGTRNCLLRSRNQSHSNVRGLDDHRDVACTSVGSSTLSHSTLCPSPPAPHHHRRYWCFMTKSSVRWCGGRTQSLARSRPKATSCSRDTRLWKACPCSQEGRCWHRLRIAAEAVLWFQCLLDKSITSGKAFPRQQMWFHQLVHWWRRCARRVGTRCR